MSLRRFIPGVVMLLTLVSTGGQAMAFNTRITVYASVSEMRVIYIDKSGNITKVEGNTTKNISPRVLNENNQPATMTDSINQQYQNFLSLHGGHLEASKIYLVNPVGVNNQPNTQTITVNASSLSLSLQ